MKRQVRNSVFETNSSSTHSFTYGKTYNDLVVEEDGYVHTDLGEFGWEIEDYYESSSKLAYILLAATSFTGHTFWWASNDDFSERLESFKKTQEYMEIEDAVKTRMSCEGIIIDENSEGYIDHQSLEYDSFDSWLADTGASSIEDFIFGDIVLHTDNDNH